MKNEKFRQIMAGAMLSALSLTSLNAMASSAYGLVFNDYTLDFTEKMDVGTTTNVFSLDPDEKGDLKTHIKVRDLSNKPVEMHLKLFPAREGRVKPDYSAQSVDLTINTDGSLHIENMQQYQAELKNMNTEKLDVSLVKLSMLNNYQLSQHKEKVVVKGEAFLVPDNSLLDLTRDFGLGLKLLMAGAGLTLAATGVAMIKSNSKKLKF